MDNLKTYREYFDNMGSLNYFGRLGKTFMTQKNYYYYDMGTGKVARVNKNVYIVLKVLTEDGNFKKVMDIAEIMQYGVMRTPALVIDEKVVVSGRVPSKDELKEILKKLIG